MECDHALTVSILLPSKKMEMELDGREYAPLLATEVVLMILSHLNNLKEVLNFLSTSPFYYNHAAEYLRERTVSKLFDSITLRDPTLDPTLGAIALPRTPRWLTINLTYSLRLINPSYRMLAAIRTCLHVDWLDMPLKDLSCATYDGFHGLVQFTEDVVGFNTSLAVGEWVTPVRARELAESSGVCQLFAENLVVEIGEVMGSELRDIRRKNKVTHLTVIGCSHILLTDFTEIYDSFPNLVTLDVRATYFGSSILLDVSRLPVKLRTLSLTAAKVHAFESGAGPRRLPSLMALNVRALATEGGILSEPDSRNIDDELFTHDGWPTEPMRDYDALLTAQGVVDRRHQEVMRLVEANRRPRRPRRVERGEGPPARRRRRSPVDGEGSDYSDASSGPERPRFNPRRLPGIMGRGVEEDFRPSSDSDDDLLVI